MARKTKTEAVPEVVIAEPVAELTMREQLHRMLDEALDDATAPTWKRRAVGLLASVAVAAGAGYIGGYASVAVAIGAALVTSSMFVFWLMYILGMLLTMYYGGKLSMWSYNKVVDKSVDRAWHWAKAWFNPLHPGMTA